jgi:hypothetical protein
MQNTLRQRELEVQEARVRFADDLAVLRSPKNFAALTEDMKRDALEAKNELVHRAKRAAQSKAAGVLEDIKAKAAANPAATLMIGAGVGWYLLRHPPITTALIGYGLFSLLRTDASAQPRAQTRDYVRQGQERLKQQATEFASQVADKASSMAQEAGATIAEKSGELFDATKVQVTRLVQGTGDKVSVGVSAAQDQVSTIIAKASGMAADLPDRAEQPPASSQVSRSFDTMPIARARDGLLLGVAGFAIAAALGIAWQKRATEKGHVR